jgi:hypothetical protein
MWLKSIDISNYQGLQFFVIREGDADRLAWTAPGLCRDMLAAPAVEVSVFAVLEFSRGIALTLETSRPI